MMLPDPTHPEYVIPGTIAFCLTYAYLLVAYGLMPAPAGYEGSKSFWLFRPIIIAAAGFLLAWMVHLDVERGPQELRLYRTGLWMIGVGLALEAALLRLALEPGRSREERMEAVGGSTLNYVVPCLFIVNWAVQTVPRLCFSENPYWDATVYTTALIALALAVRRQ